MANKKQYYVTATGEVTSDVHQHITSWRQLSEPLEKILGLELISFDPNFIFSYKGTVIQLPLAFVRILTTLIQNQRQEIQNLKDVMVIVQEQLAINFDELPETLDNRIHEWVEATVMGNPPNLRQPQEQQSEQQCIAN